MEGSFTPALSEGSAGGVGERGEQIGVYELATISDTEYFSLACVPLLARIGVAHRRLAGSKVLTLEEAVDFALRIIQRCALAGASERGSGWNRSGTHELSPTGRHAVADESCNRNNNITGCFFMQSIIARFRDQYDVAVESERLGKRRGIAVLADLRFGYRGAKVDRRVPLGGKPLESF